MRPRLPIQPADRRARQEFEHEGAGDDAHVTEPVAQVAADVHVQPGAPQRQQDHRQQHPAGQHEPAQAPEQQADGEHQVEVHLEFQGPGDRQGQREVRRRVRIGRQHAQRVPERQPVDRLVEVGDAAVEHEHGEEGDDGVHRPHPGEALDQEAGDLGRATVVVGGGVAHDEAADEEEQVDPHGAREQDLVREGVAGGVEQRIAGVGEDDEQRGHAAQQLDPVQVLGVIHGVESFPPRVGWARVRNFNRTGPSKALQFPPGPAAQAARLR